MATKVISHEEGSFLTDVKEIRRSIKANRGEHAQLYLAEDDLFRISSQVGDHPAGYAYAEEHPHLRDRTTVVGRAALAGETVQIPDVLADADYSFPAQAIVGFRALLG